MQNSHCLLGLVICPLHNITTFKCYENLFFISQTCKQASRALDFPIPFVLSPKCPTPKSGMIEFCYIQWIINIIHTANKEFNSFQKKRVTLCVNAMMAPTVVTRNHSFNTLQMVSSPFFALVQKTFQYFCVEYKDICRRFLHSQMQDYSQCDMWIHLGFK